MGIILKSLEIKTTQYCKLEKSNAPMKLWII